MNHRTSIVISEDQAKLSYSLSLQTTPDIVKNGYMEMCHIEFLEFLELIGRFANYYLPNEELHFAINKVLDKWLYIVGFQRFEPNYYEDIEESDWII